MRKNTGTFLHSPIYAIQRRPSFRCQRTNTLTDYVNTLSAIETSSRTGCASGTSSMVSRPCCRSKANRRLLLPLHYTAELRCLYAQGEVYGDYVDAFFARHPHPGMSWVHDIEKGRWGVASQTLLAQSNRTSDLEIRHVCPVFSTQ